VPNNTSSTEHHWIVCQILAMFLWQKFPILCQNRFTVSSVLTDLLFVREQKHLA